MQDHEPRQVETLRLVAAKPAGLPAPRTLPAPPKPASWWGQYVTTLRRLPADTQRVVEDDASYIVAAAVPTSSGQVDREAFGDDRVRTGIVVGPVQSGKTANMLAVAALLLDQGVDILVVLAGTRVALWLQTYERLLHQLDATDLRSAWKRNPQRVLVPQPEDVLSGADHLGPHRYLAGARLKVRQALQKKSPVIFVVPKEDDHLLALARFLEQSTGPAVTEGRGQPLTLVVLDDEADDASILDAREGSRITPQFIQHLWSSDKHAPATRHSELLATYIAYTATPQANYLQRSHNPLAPRSFQAALRVPADQGSPHPRTVTYTEQAGLKSYYCGGEVFYERLRGLPGDLCVPFPFPQLGGGSDDAAVAAQHEDVRWQMVGESMRAYMVAGAVRLYEQGKWLSAVPSTPAALVAIQRATPAPHSMLYHPSALKEAHFAGAVDLARWSCAAPGGEAEVQLPIDEHGNSVTALDPSGLARRLDLEEAKWEAWLTAYKASADSLASLSGSSSFAWTAASWSEIRSLLIDEVFPHTRLRVLNSDPRADDRPRFAPAASEQEGLWEAPQDIYTIFVAGNVLSRGLTVEGLCTSLFLRGAKEPAADTQMQMQRWFGYRGEHLPFCRVFLFQDQLDLFRQYHTNDTALKTEILSYMDGHTATTSREVLVLQGEAFRATGKVDSRKVPLHPGATPAVRLVESPGGDHYDANISLVNRLLRDDCWQELEYPAEVRRGLIRTEPVSMVTVASILEQLRYSSHDPDPQLDLSQRWVSLQRTLKLDQPLFRPPGLNPGPMAVGPDGCPYSIAAYLRLWSEALTRHDVPGMQPTDNPQMPWSMLNLAAYQAAEPKFYLGLRFGAEGMTTSLSFRGEPLPAMRRGLANERDGLLETLWGSRSPTERWRGDQAFDYHLHGPERAPRLLESGAWRPRGEPGLVLIHPVLDPKTGKEMIAVGLALPHGGPDHVAALRTGRQSFL
jgi:hypothetical protein